MSRAAVMRWTGRAAVAVVVLLVLAQVVPYGRDHDNPPAADPVQWPSVAAERLARSACYDCHSDETRWPWYSHVAPASWLVQRDVDRGRAAVNFSAMRSSDEDAVEEIADVVEDDDMPPRRYLIAHPAARLSKSDKATLVQALDVVANAADEPDGSGRRGRGRGPGGSGPG